MRYRRPSRCVRACSDDSLLGTLSILTLLLFQITIVTALLSGSIAPFEDLHQDHLGVVADGVMDLGVDRSAAGPSSGRGIDGPGDDAQEAMRAPGAVIAALVIELPRALTDSADDSEDAPDAGRAPPLVVELHTATWCQPCRAAEREVANLSAMWPTVTVLAHHSSDAAIDSLSVAASREARVGAGIDGFPTVLLNGVWALNGSRQSADLSSLVGNVTASGGLLNAPARIDSIALAASGWSWNASEERLSVSWSLAGANATDHPNLAGASLETWLIRDGIDGGSLGFLPDVVVAGAEMTLSNDSSDGLHPTSEGTAVVDVANATSRNGYGGQRIVLLLRAPGVQLRSGSMTPLDGQQSAPPQPVVQNGVVDRYPMLPWIALVTGVLLMLPALRHTVPILLPDSRKNQHTMDDSDERERDGPVLDQEPASSEE